MPWDPRAPRAMPADIEVTPAVAAATVIPLRDGPDGLEALFLRRNSKLEFAGGMWVFPGGRLDPADWAAGDEAFAGADVDHLRALDASLPENNEVFIDAARRAAVREAREEAGIDLDESTLVWFSHWTPPALSMKRFATWFFVAPATGDTDRVTIDGGEIHDHAWMRPADALARRNALEIELAPPTWITLECLRYKTVADAMAAIAAAPAEHFVTRIALVDDGAVALYHGDAALEGDPSDGEDLDADRPGPRHRLWMLRDGWRYERDTPPATPPATAPTP